MRLAFVSLALAIVILAGGRVAAQQVTDTLRATHGDWEIHCGPGPTGIEECFMFQAVTPTGSLERVMTAVVAKPVGEAPLLRITVPLGVLLPAGVHVRVDQNDLGTVGYLACFPDGCMTQIDLTDDVVASLKAGITGVVSIQDTFGQPAELPLSLTGFTAAFDSL